MLNFFTTLCIELLTVPTVCRTVLRAPEGRARFNGFTGILWPSNLQNNPSKAKALS